MLQKYGGFKVSVDYHGQINSENKAEGFGRFSCYNGELIEGTFKNGKFSGYGRIIYDS